nr:glycerol kinase GlpK [Hahella sp. HN01]
MRTTTVSKYILAIDQGTTSSRAILFTREGLPAYSVQQEFAQHFPNDGWVEHNPHDLWDTVKRVCSAVMKEAGISGRDITCIGITNQRETTVVWDRHTGEPIYNAIVWQDRRTSAFCAELYENGRESMVREKTGLLLDPYFSGTKIRWILDNVEGAREKAERGDLLFGTVDTFLIWKMTGGSVHATDATNASRTLLFNIHSQQWDDELLDMLNVPSNMLPVVKDSSDDFGMTEHQFLGSEVPITGVAGDQQAALFGQACFAPGMCKSTYGTGCFMIMNTGDAPLESNNKLLTTVGYRLNGKPTYAIEGSIFMAGATMQWLRDGISLLKSAGESIGHAEQVGPDHSVYLVPAFTGLGAPYWEPNARGAIVGLTRDTGIAEIVTAGLQSVAYQTRDLLEAMKSDGVENLAALRVDGGMVVNDWAMQFLADILDVRVDRPFVTETTALGAAFLAGLKAGVYSSLEEVQELWQCEKTFPPSMEEAVADRLYKGWLNSVEGVRNMAKAAHKK